LKYLLNVICVKGKYNATNVKQATLRTIWRVFEIVVILFLLHQCNLSETRHKSATKTFCSPSRVFCSQRDYRVVINDDDILVC